jgi:glycosyltransferase involved in cell wall biosynthesis
MEPENFIYSIIVPAYNEEVLMASTVEAINTSMLAVQERGELIVVDNDSTDATASIAQSLGAKVVHESVRQISRSRNAGAKAAKGQLLIFIDADTQLTPQILKEILLQFSKRKICGGGVLIHVPQELNWQPRFYIRVWNFMSAKLRWSAGCCIFCRKNAFEAVGGFDEKVYASEEIGLCRRLKHWGKYRNMDWHIITSQAIVTSMRKLEWYSAAQLLIPLLTIAIFPFAVRSKRMCYLWYRRPKTKAKTESNN